MFTENYRVEFMPFAQSHYVKGFEKRHKSKWQVTRKAIVAQLGRIDAVVESSRAEIIKKTTETWLIKLNFAVAGVNKSPSGSGNRLIAYVDHKAKKVSVLLVYSKNDIGSPNETQKWQQIIKDEYPEIWDSFRALE